MISVLLHDEELIRKVIADLLNVAKYMNLGIMIALAYGAVYLLYVFTCKILKKERKFTTGSAIAVFALLHLSIRK